MPFRIVRRAWPRGGTDKSLQPLEQRILSAHETRQQAEQEAEALAARFAYHRFDAAQDHWTVRNEEGPTFTLTVERD